MKIMIVTPYFYPKIGGMEHYAHNIVEGLHEKYSCELIVVTSNHIENKYKVEYMNGYKIYRLPIWFKLSNTPINFLWFYQIRNIIKRERPDLINAHTPVPFISDVAAILSKIYRIPFVLTYQNDLEKDNIISKLIIKLYYLTLGKLTFNYSDKIIATSKYYSEKSKYIRKYLSKVNVISPGVYLPDKKSVESSKVQLRKYTNKKVILFISQLDKTHIHKGLYYLLDSIYSVKNKHKNIKLVVIGSGDDLDNYKKYSQKIGIANFVDFMGMVPNNKLQHIESTSSNKQLLNYIMISSLVVLPSTNNCEGFGMCLIEGMACKKPAIGSNTGGIPFVIDHKINGLLVKPKNSKELAKAIIKILDNPKLAKKMGENGYKKVKDKFTWDKKIKETYEIILNVLKK